MSYGLSEYAGIEYAGEEINPDAINEEPTDNIELICARLCGSTPI